MPRLYNMHLLLRRFLIDYYRLLERFQQDRPPAPDGLDIHGQMSCTLFFLLCSEIRPLEFTAAALECGLPIHLAQLLDYYEGTGRTDAA